MAARNPRSRLGIAGIVALVLGGIALLASLVWVARWIGGAL